MKYEDIEIGSAKDWLRYAKSDLVLSKVKEYEGVLLSTLCFHAQQAVEKSLKAILIYYKIPIAKTHNIKKIIDTLPESLEIPDFVNESIDLTEFSVLSRYPGGNLEVWEDEYLEAIKIAEKVYLWAIEMIA